MPHLSRAFLLGNATEGIPPIHNKHTACVFRKTETMRCVLSLGNTAQRASGDFARHLLANFPSYFTKMLVNTSSIHSAFCFIWRKIWRRICRTIFVRYCLNSIYQKSGLWKCRPDFLETNVISAVGQTGSYIFNKKALDKRCILAYNRNRKSIPVDGLLPLLVVKKT